MDDPYPSYYILAQITQPSVSYLVINGLLFILLLIGSALVSGSEVAFFSLSNEDIASIQDEDPSVGTFAVAQVCARRRCLPLRRRLLLDQVEQILRLAFVVEDDAAGGVLAAVLRQVVGVDVEHFA